MKQAILGKKIGMTQLFREDGTMIPVTVVLAGPCPVTQVKTVEHDGYDAVQMAFQPVREKLITKPQMGHLRKAGVEAHRYPTEISAGERRERRGDDHKNDRADIHEGGQLRIGQRGGLQRN